MAVHSVESRSVSIQRTGLARKLGWIALSLFLLPSLLIVLFGALELWDWDTNSPVFAAIQVLPPFAMFAAPVVGMAALFTRGLRRQHPGALEVDEAHVSVRRGRRATKIPLGAIAEGWVSPLQQLVEIRLKSGDMVRAVIGSQARGQALLEALGLSATRRTMNMQLGETTFLDIMTWLCGLPVTLSIAIGLFANVAARYYRYEGQFLLFSIIVAIGLMWTLKKAVHAIWAPAEVVVGADGVKIRQGLGERFVPYAKLVRMRAERRAVTLVLDGAEPVRARARHITDRECAKLQARLDEAMAVWKAGGSETASLARLDRNGRTKAAWRDALRKILTSDEGYREARVTRDQLLGVLEDASAGVERRIAAAEALRVSEPETRVRIRMAAEACANKRVRIALEKVADGAIDDAAIDEAIAAEAAAAPRVREVEPGPRGGP